VNRRIPNDWFTRELPPGLEIGERSFLISSYAFLHCSAAAKVRIGNDTGIYHGTFFELGPAANVHIGDYCTLVGAILQIESELRIGNYVLIAHEVVITDGEAVSSARSITPRPIVIGEDAWIGMRAIILQGVTIGRGAIVGAGTVVTEDVPSMSIVSGNPARLIRKVDDET
jgi:acetyltransferase-like isoleucine patch superfamily enzyme